MRISTTRWAWPEDSPLRQSARRLRLKYHAWPVAIVWRKASAFMCATINTSPDRASVATQMTRPSASNFGAKARPSSTSSIEPRGAKDEVSSDKKNLAQKSESALARRATQISPAMADAGSALYRALARGGWPACAGHHLRLRCQARSGRRSAIGLAHHGDEADLVVGIVLKAAGELRGDGGRSRLLHAAQRHAHVLGLDHHRHAARGQDLLDGGGDLRGHTLLRLQPARIDVDEAGKLGKSHHPVHRIISYVRLAHERHHVVLAMGIEGDIAHQHEVVIPPDLAERAFEHIDRAFAIAAVKFFIGVDHALGRIADARSMCSNARSARSADM